MGDGLPVVGVAISQVAQRASRPLKGIRAAAAQKRHERLNRTRACDGHGVVGVAISKVAQRISSRCLRPRAPAARQRNDRLNGASTCDSHDVVGVTMSKIAQRDNRRFLRLRAAAAQKRHERLDRTSTRDSHAIVGVLDHVAAQLRGSQLLRAWLLLRPRAAAAQPRHKSCHVKRSCVPSDFCLPGASALGSCRATQQQQQLHEEHVLGGGHVEQRATRALQDCTHDKRAITALKRPGSGGNDDGRWKYQVQPLKIYVRRIERPRTTQCISCGRLRKPAITCASKRQTCVCPLLGNNWRC